VLSISTIFYTIDEIEAKEKEENKEKFSYADKYLKSLQRQGVIGEKHILVEIFYIPDDEPLDEEKAEQAYCYLLSKEKDLEAAMRASALFERVIIEFDKKEVDKYYQSNFCDNVEKILDEKNK
jgi:hypothetical protein